MDCEAYGFLSFRPQALHAIRGSRRCQIAVKRAQRCTTDSVHVEIWLFVLFFVVETVIKVDGRCCR